MKQKTKNLKEAFALTRRNMRRAGRIQTRYYILRRREWPEVGHQALTKMHHLSNAPENFAGKLAPKYDGPYIVRGF